MPVMTGLNIALTLSLIVTCRKGYWVTEVGGAVTPDTELGNVQLTKLEAEVVLQELGG